MAYLHDVEHTAHVAIREVQKSILTVLGHVEALHAPWVRWVRESERVRVQQGVGEEARIRRRGEGERHRSGAIKERRGVECTG